MRCSVEALGEGFMWVLLVFALSDGVTEAALRTYIHLMPC